MQNMQPIIQIEFGSEVKYTADSILETQDIEFPAKTVITNNSRHINLRVTIQVCLKLP